MGCSNNEQGRTAGPGPGLTMALGECSTWNIDESDDLTAARFASRLPITLLDSLSNQLDVEIRMLDAQGRRRSLPELSGPSRVELTSRGEALVSFCSNDYLGLSSHPALAHAAAKAAASSGFGAGASRLVAGDLPEHRALEGELASLVRLPTALLFPTGYQANLAVLTALAGPEDLIVADRAIHASLIDGCRLCRAKLAFYPHLDLDKAAHHLTRLGRSARRRFVVTESLFSMDGDPAPLAELSTLAKVKDAILIVDEAHALGVLGPDGAGLCAAQGVLPDILVGTLGKSLGASGAFVAGPAILRDYLINRARSFIFTTALPPPVAAAALQAVDLVRSAEGTSLRRRLAVNIAAIRSLLRLPPDALPSPIVPIILGSDQAAVEASEQLRRAGLFVQPIRPPSVREGTARLRLTFSALHTPAHLSRLGRALTPVRNGPSAPLAPAEAPPAGPFPDTLDLGAPSKPRGIFIAGTDTGVGKTCVSRALLKLMTDRLLRPMPFKPVETGADPEPRDAFALREAAARTDVPVSAVCPLPFRTPIAPAAAAAAEGTEISLEILRRHFANAASLGSVVLVESAGGLLSPYARGLSGADLAAAFELPVLLIARNGLGTVNHTALAIAEIRRRGLPLLGIILVDVAQAPSPDQPFNADLIAGATGIQPLGVLPYLPEPATDALARQLEDSVDLRPVWAALAT